MFPPSPFINKKTEAQRGYEWVQEDTADRWQARTLKSEMFGALNHNLPPQSPSLDSGGIGPDGL